MSTSDDRPYDQESAHEEPTAGHPPVWTVTLGFFSLLGLRSVLAHSGPSGRDGPSMTSTLRTSARSSQPCGSD